MYRTVVTICTVQWSLYVPYSGHYMYRTVVTICTVQWSLYAVASLNLFYFTSGLFCAFWKGREEVNPERWSIIHPWWRHESTYADRGTDPHVLNFETRWRWRWAVRVTPWSFDVHWVGGRTVRGRRRCCLYKREHYCCFRNSNCERFLFMLLKSECWGFHRAVIVCRPSGIWH